MKANKEMRAALLAAALCAASALSAAQDGPAPQPQTTSSGIEYVSGGVGQLQRQAMEAMSQDYNLRLTFARRGTGAYLADVKVTVENMKKETMLDVVSSGPMLFAKLPAGSYRVAAELGGQRQVQQATIKPGRPRGLIYYFPRQGNDATPAGQRGGG